MQKSEFLGEFPCGGYLAATMKKRIQWLLQRILGFRRYLFLFSLYKIRTLGRDQKEGDFLHFVKMLPVDAVVLDIGANIGIMTAWLAKHCKQGQIHAFEPIPENLAALTRIVNHFKFANVTLHGYALGDQPGELQMVMPEVQHVKMQGLSHVVHESIPDFNDGKMYKVPVKMLDKIPELKKVAGIKIDVENFEFFVLKGGETMLRRDKPVIYAELWANENRDRCFELLTGLGYAIKVLDHGNLQDFDAGKHHNQNFFFV